MVSRSSVWRVTVVTYLAMAPKQRMRIANEKASKNVTLRGNVPKSSVSKTTHTGTAVNSYTKRFVYLTELS